MKVRSIILQALLVLIIIIFVSSNCKKSKFTVPEKFSLVPGGTFQMGDETNSAKKDNGDNDEKPVHQVKVGSFYLSRYETTQKEWKDVMGKNPAYFIGENLPVEHVSWYDSIEYCNRLSKMEGLRPYYKINKLKKNPLINNKYDTLKWTVTFNKYADGYRLPTEAEWEYAARYIDGKTWTPSSFASGAAADFNNIRATEEVAWYIVNSNNITHPVGMKKPNSLGIYDMSGNVWEWCWDLNERYQGNTDKSYYDGNNYRILRGGAWSYDDAQCRVSNRACHVGSLKTDHYGIRLVLPVQ